MKAYIASGWFTPAQEECLNEVLSVCKEAGIEVYSPRDDMEYKPGMNAGLVFDANCEQIRACDVVIASTEGKDMGTLWECGYAYAKNKRVVYYYPHTGKFNLMLAESATAVCDCKARLEVYLREIVKRGYVISMPYIGGVE